MYNQAIPSFTNVSCLSIKTLAKNYPPLIYYTDNIATMRLPAASPTYYAKITKALIFYDNKIHFESGVLRATFHSIVYFFYFRLSRTIGYVFFTRLKSIRKRIRYGRVNTILPSAYSLANC